MSFTASGKYRIGGEYFIYEADEYDKNFLHFNPKFSLITTVDYDHPDTYPSKEDYNKAFSLFISQSQKTIMWDEDAQTLGLKKSGRIEFIKYQDYQHHLWPNLIGIKLPFTFTF